MSRHKSKAIPGRNLRLADQIQKDLAGIIQREIDDPRWTDHALGSGAVDRLRAREGVFHGPGRRAEAATALLNEKAGWLHSQLYKLLHIHTVPTLRFFHDEQIARGIEMSILIDRANRSGPIRACLTNLKTSPDRAVVAASTFRIPTMAKRRGLALDGVLLLDKPVGLSSNHTARQTHGGRGQAGHTGTLDPFATGLLLCCMGRATKISGAMLNADKTYRATLQFGETDSGDLTGNVVATAAPGFTVTEQALRDALSRFRARSSRFRPCTRRSSATASRCTSMRGRGIELERPPRQVTIYRIELLSLSGTQAEIDVACSKGTYIRTLAQDIGRALECYAHLAALRRTHVGPFSLDRAVTLDALQAMQTPSRHCLH